MWDMLPVDVDTTKADYGLLVLAKDDTALFTVTKQNDKFVWTKADKKIVGMEDTAENRYVLLVTAPVEVDAMVALWCCRVWQHSAINTPVVDDGMEGGMHTKLLYITKILISD